MGFEERNHVHSLCQGRWSSLCRFRSLSGKDHLLALQTFSFLLCAHGEGVEPNPQAWTALLHGVIPVIRHFPGVPYLPAFLCYVWVTEFPWKRASTTGATLGSPRSGWIRLEKGLLHSSTMSSFGAGACRSFCCRIGGAW